MLCANSFIYDGEASARIVLFVILFTRGTIVDIINTDYEMYNAHTFNNIPFI